MEGTAGKVVHVDPNGTSPIRGIVFSVILYMQHSWVNMHTVMYTIKAEESVFKSTHTNGIIVVLIIYSTYLIIESILL